MSEVVILLALLVASTPLVMFWQGLRATTLSASPLREPLAWLISKSPAKTMALAAVGGLMSVAILVVTGIGLSRVPWELSAKSPATTSSGGMCDPAGAVYIIHVHAGTYVCGGGDGKCPKDDVSVAYDPVNPNLCRVRSNVDRPSLYELHALLFALGWLCFAAARSTWQGLPQAGAPLMPQSSLHRAFVVALGSVLAAMLASAVLYHYHS
jgi:hypothetical protein